MQKISKRWIYYTVLRWAAPGAVPREGLVGAEDYPARTFISGIGRQAWSKAYYNRKLSESELREYEMVADPENPEEEVA